MSSEIDAFRHHHDEIRGELDRQVGRILGGSDEGLVRLRDYLFDELLPHARGEERHLYPTVAPLLCREGTAMATMTMDHEAIERLVDRYANLLADRPRNRVEIERTLAALHAIVELHLAKEERVLLPALERHASASELRSILAGVEEPSVRD